MASEAGLTTTQRGIGLRTLRPLSAAPPSAPKPALPVSLRFTLTTSFGIVSQYANKATNSLKEVQPTEWSRKQSLIGRPIDDIRAWELSHRGLSEFSLRLLSEGRYQGIDWTRSASGAVFTTQLRANSSREFESWIWILMKWHEHVSSKKMFPTNTKTPLNSCSDCLLTLQIHESQASHESYFGGINCLDQSQSQAGGPWSGDPDKREAQDSLPSNLDLPISDSNPGAPKRAKSNKDSNEEEAQKLLKSPSKNKLNSRPKGATDHTSSKL